MGALTNVVTQFFEIFNPSPTIKILFSIQNNATSKLIAIK